MALSARFQLVARSSHLYQAAAAAARCYSDYGDKSGAVRDAGGAFGKREKAVEDQYFRRLEQEQLEKMKKARSEHHEEEIQHHEDAIEELKEQIARHKAKIERHKRKMDDDD